MRKLALIMMLTFGSLLSYEGNARNVPVGPTLKKMYCSSQKTSWACKYMSEGEDCPLSSTTNCP